MRLLDADLMVIYKWQKGNTTMKSVSLKVPDELHAKLATLAAQRNVGKSEVLRAALEAYFGEPVNGSEPTCADLAGNLIGCLEGPADLATNPKHMRGYGR